MKLLTRECTISPVWPRLEKTMAYRDPRVSAKNLSHCPIGGINRVPLFPRHRAALPNSPVHSLRGADSSVKFSPLQGVNSGSYMPLCLSLPPLVKHYKWLNETLLALFPELPIPGCWNVGLGSLGNSSTIMCRLAYKRFQGFDVRACLHLYDDIIQVIYLRLKRTSYSRVDCMDFHENILSLF